MLNTSSVQATNAISRMYPQNPQNQLFSAPKQVLANQDTIQDEFTQSEDPISDLQNNLSVTSHETFGKIVLNLVSNMEDIIPILNPFTTAKIVYLAATERFNKNQPPNNQLDYVG